MVTTLEEQAKKEKKFLKNFFILGLCLIIVGAIVPTICIVKSIQFDQNCEGYLKQAADANTVELASERISKALEYIEENNLTTGYTSVLWKTEDENVEYWYNNIKACQSELKMAVNSSQLEKTNLLMKVRESLTDIGKGDNGGTIITIPKGISRYPNNTSWGVLRWISWIVFSIGILIVVIVFANWCEKNGND